MDPFWPLVEKWPVVLVFLAGVVLGLALGISIGLASTRKLKRRLQHFIAHGEVLPETRDPAHPPQ